jgi:hypothetical protein
VFDVGPGQISDDSELSLCLLHVSGPGLCRAAAVRWHPASQPQLAAHKVYAADGSRPPPPPHAPQGLLTSPPPELPLNAIAGYYGRCAAAARAFAPADERPRVCLCQRLAGLP